MCATSVRDFNASLLEHDPEKWKPVFRKDHAQQNAGAEWQFVKSRPAPTAKSQGQRRNGPKS
jgi:hypothetical protein